MYTESIATLSGCHTAANHGQTIDPQFMEFEINCGLWFESGSGSTMLVLTINHVCAVMGLHSLKIHGGVNLFRLVGNRKATKIWTSTDQGNPDAEPYPCFWCIQYGYG